jgi:hypothetical protein
VLAWRLSITMEAAFCVETLEDALARHGKPDIFPLGSLTPAEAPLIEAENLFRQPGPPHSTSWIIVQKCRASGKIDRQRRAEPLTSKPD